MQQRLQTWVILIILTIAAGLRLYGLGNESFWADELGQLVVAQNGWWETILKSANHRGSTPLDYLITHWMLYVGRGEAILRLPAVMFGVGSVWLLDLLGTRLFNRTAGLASAGLLAFAPIHIFYSQEMRFYSLATFTILATLYIFTLAMDYQTRQHWLWFSVILTISLYAHYYSMLILLALGGWILMFKRDALPWFALSSGIALSLFFPWLWWDVIRPGTANSNPVEFVMPPLIETVGSLFFPRFKHESCQMRCHTAGWLLVIGAPVMLIAALRKADRKEMLMFPVFVLALGYSGILGLNIYGRYFFHIRQALVFLPFLLLAGVGSLVIISRQHAPLVVSIVLITAVLAFGPKIREIHSIQTKADFRGVSAYLLEHMDEDAALMTSVPEYLLYYEPRLAPYIIRVDRNNALEEFDKLRSQGKTVWFVPYGRGARVFQPIFEEHQRQRHPSLIPRVYAIPRPNKW